MRNLFITFNINMETAMVFRRALAIGATLLTGAATATFLAAAIQTQAAAPAARAQDDGEMSTRGIVTSVPSGTVYGTWTIGGNAYEAVTGTTQVEIGERGSILNRCAEVRYTQQGETRTAFRIRPSFECGFGDGEGDHDGSRGETKGVLESFPAELVGEWRVSGITYTASISTYFAQREHPFVVGNCVEIKHAMSSTVALAIKSDDDRECGDARESVGRAKGTLQSFPAEITGTWMVNSVTYQVVSTTLLNRDHGDFYVGGCIEVRYDISDTNRTAFKVETESLDDCAERPVLSSTLEARGVVSATPISGTLFGTWTIGGEAYEAISGTTRFNVEHGMLQVGDCAKVRYLNQGGQRVALRIDSDERHGCRRGIEESKLYGIVRALPGTPNQIGIWKIGERPMLVSTATLQTGGPFTVGMLVEAKFVRNPAGALVATKIEAKRNSQIRGREGKSYGILQDRPISPTVLGTWTIASTTYAVTSTTRLTGSLDVGNCAVVHFRSLNGQRTARKIRGLATTECTFAGRVVSETYGTVEQMPTQGFIGTWMIGGKAYEMRATTRFKQEHGALATGAFVEVKFRTENGVNIALEVESEVPPMAGETNSTGRVSQSSPADAAIARVDAAQETITVDGVQYVITRATMVDDGAGALGAGSRVAINSYTDATGQRVATSVVVLASSIYAPVVGMQ